MKINDLIATSFNKAAVNYNKNAILQKKIAKDLAFKINKNIDFDIYSVFEVGCGTGFLTEYLLAYLNDDIEYIASDIAPNMLNLIQDKFKDKIKYQIFDMNKPKFSKKYDLIVSSMALQWSNNLSSSLQEFAKYGKMIAFSTMIDGSFNEWLEFCDDNGIKPKTLDFLSYNRLDETINKSMPNAKKIIITTEKITKEYPTILSFLSSLKAIGANNSYKSNIINKKMHNILTNTSKPINITYNIAYCIIII